MSNKNESCHIRKSHVTYELVMSHMNESCRICRSHVTYDTRMSHEFCGVNEFDVPMSVELHMSDTFYVA